jgi:hypothetical protein
MASFRMTTEVRTVRRPWRLMLVAFAGGLLALFWKELPALRRYLKAERM